MATNWSGWVIKNSQTRKITLVLEHDMIKGKMFWSFPGGKKEADDKTPLITALRELEEEALLKIKSVSKVQQLLENVDISSGEFCDMFITEEENTTPVSAKSDEEILLKKPLSILEIEDMKKKGFLKKKSGLIFEIIKDKIFLQSSI